MIVKKTCYNTGKKRWVKTRHWGIMQKQIENEVKNSLLRKRENLLILTLGKNKPIIIRYWDILQKNCVK